MYFERFQKLYEKKAKKYEHIGKGHFPIEINKNYSGNDISAHLHCKIVELWLAVKLNQSIEQIVDELADILCIWNLALVLYEDASGVKISFEEILANAEKQISNNEIINLHADPKKEWKLDKGHDFSFSSLSKTADLFIKAHNLEIAYNLGQEISIDVFGLLHHAVNEFWNAIRKNQYGYYQILKELTNIFGTWVIAVRLISRYTNTDISIDNLIEISTAIFKNVAKKKFNIDI